MNTQTQGSIAPKLVFAAEWQEPFGPAPRKFILTYYTSNSTVEMFDVKNRRLFLRRTPCNTIELANLYVGNKVNVLSRLLTLTDYGDTTTRDIIGGQMERILILLKAEVMFKLGDILVALQNNNIDVRNMSMFILTPKQQQAVERKFMTPSACQIFMSSGKVMALQLNGVELEQKWNDIKCQLNIVESTYASSGREASDNEINLIFEGVLGLDSIECNTALFHDCTCCIIKPHAIAEGNLGRIVQKILDGSLDITALKMIHLDIERADEFFEVYRGIIPGYQRMLEEVTSGPSLILEVSGPAAQPKLRDIVGPHDPEVAKELRPGTIRAHFGKDRIRNAVHCTDLPEDALLEVEYFFKIMSAH